MMIILTGVRDALATGQCFPNADPQAIEDMGRNKLNSIEITKSLKVFLSSFLLLNINDKLHF